jgi:hypothetical protein
MTDTLSVLRAVDALYESVVTSPDSWGPQAFADWAEDLASGGLTRDQARAVRRCVRAAQKMRDFWASGGGAVSADDWRTRVDVSLGARAWRPPLELAMTGLSDDPSEELFEEVAQRFRVVNSQPWMDGVDYAAWRDRAAPS